jgi:spore coat assembly protein SafA
MAKICISLGQRQLHFYPGLNREQIFPVGIGKPETPTPPGNYQVITKIVNPGGILGSRWLGLSIAGGNYGIHGTPYPQTIGKQVSLGCIRMYNENIEAIFPQVAIGTPVIIVSGYCSTQEAIPAQTPYRSYTVRPGDSLWAIADRFGTTLAALLAANPDLSNPELIYPGQTITIPSVAVDP